MDRKADIIFRSGGDQDGRRFQIASGHISETSILFENEDIVAVVEARGSVKFYDREDRLLASGEVPAESCGREVYEEISCHVEGTTIRLHFPICEWVDYYPNCDGEHDRWGTRMIGSYILTFDRETNTVTCSK